MAEKYKLSDVDVETVGLVTMGANREKFFLLKSDKEDVVMSEEIVKEDQVQVNDGFFARMKDVLSEVIAPLKAEPVVEAAIADLAPVIEVAKKDEPEKEEDTHEKIALLEKANATLLERMEKAEREAQEARDAREQQVFLEKAAGFGRLPAKADELAGFLRFVHKADVKQGEFIDALLKATNDALAEGGSIFQEAGVSQGVEGGDAVDNLDQVLKGGSIEDIKKALIGLSPQAARGYLHDRRVQIKTHSN